MDPLPSRNDGTYNVQSLFQAGNVTQIVSSEH